MRQSQSPFVEDSDTYGRREHRILPASSAVLDELFTGLQGDPSARIMIEGH